MTSKKIGAVILSAGYSSRMGTFKPLLPLGDKTVIQTVLDTVKAVGIQEIVVVTGYNRQALQPVLRQEDTALAKAARGSVREAYNAEFAAGMFSSVQAGVRALSESLDGFFLLPVDCPLVGAETLQTLMDGFVPGTDCFAVPCWHGKKGHPLLIPSCYRQEILSHDGSGGLKAITDRDHSKMMRIPVEREGILLDMDDREGYETIKAYLARGCRSEDLCELAKGRRFFLIRHGQIRQHREKIFLGQTDVPLSETGKVQAKQVAEVLSRYELRTDRIYTSDLKRAAETAQIIADSLGKTGRCRRAELRQAHPEEHNSGAYAEAIEGQVAKQENAEGQKITMDVIPLKGLREMHLGPWDGKYISEIKRMYPEAYEKRGQNLFTYKMGYKSENFYDLQYRVSRAVIALLKEDPAEDVIITAHSGVLRSLYHNLRGQEIDRPWERMENGAVRVLIL